MLLVISPAKNLDFETVTEVVGTTQADFLNDAEQLIGELKGLAPQDISKLMKISDKLGVLNYDRFQQWQRPLKTPQAKAAALAFNGDVYSGLGASELSDEQLAFAQQHLRILSGLYGLLRPLDLMLPYRLEMGTRFENARGKDLYSFWGNQITEALNAQLQALNSTVLINLASNEYFKSVKLKGLNADVITPVFKDEKNGQYKVISFYAKKARGLMCRFVIEQGLTQPEQLKDFAGEGYGFDESLSTAKEWVFTRAEQV